MITDKDQEIRARFVRGLLDYIILQQLNVKELYGYELIANIRKIFGVNYGASIIYPYLADMEENGCVSSYWNLDNERPRKMYTLTEEGKRLRVVFGEKIGEMLQKLNNLTIEDLVTQVSPVEDDEDI